MAQLSKWERGITVESQEQEDMAVYLWFYEWNMFDAVHKGEHTSGSHDFPKTVNVARDRAVIQSDGLTLITKATEDGADLALTAVNQSGHDWPEVAGIIPCFNPGPPQGQTPQRNSQFIDNEHTRTYFLAESGLALLEQREIHFNQALRRQIENISPDGRFVFSGKWPTSNQHATAGIIVRESVDGQWVSGIAWENFLSAQGHNPWNCMHLAVQVGPLKPSETKTVRGRIYLFRGSKEECLKRFHRDFAFGQ